MFDPKPVLAQLPNLPGVYRMKNAADEVIYVGKARDLKKRVSSYFTKNHASPRTTIMVSHIAAIETTITGSEAEALILENNLIKALAPRYNVLFRDDKSYPYIMVTSHAFPQIRFYRGNHIKPHRYFGPFPSTTAVRDTLNHLQRIFKLRTCDDSVYAHRSRPCLIHQIGRCSAPCVGLVSAEAYARDVENATLFLQGKESEIVDQLTAKMAAAAEAMEFEEAAAYRDQIRNLQRILTKQFVESASGRDVDVIAAQQKAGIWCVNLVMIRGGRHLGDKSLFPANAHEADAEAILAAFIAQHYHSQTPPPQLIVDGDFDTEEWEATLSEAAGRAIKIVTRPIAEAKVWMTMAAKNAQFAIDQKLAEKSSQEKKLLAMREALGLENLERVECFDISHTMGEATVASCVVFDRGAMQPSEYRRYNITGITPGDDYAAMRDALTRRYKKLLEPQPDEDSKAAPPRPDLILIDGGKGQLGVAEEVMSDLGLTDIALIGVAKGEERKPGLETLIFGGSRQESHLQKDNLGFHLIQHIRDEAHRFAITGHRARRAKKRNNSRLEDIAGIGPKRRKALLAWFGGLQGVQDASVEDLAKVEGISRELAETLYNELH
ncbi:MAG: excinuclease ABC subunit UvrC [Betaproteobacteria bacterium]|nr:excinuclease ABC subunit UvrC [Betaproteobacteria bacterium]